MEAVIGKSNRMNQYFDSENSEDTEQIELFKTVLDNVGAYVFSKDLEGKYTFVNNAVCEIFDSTIDEIIGYDDSKFFSLELSNELKENDKIVVQEGKTIDTEETCIVSHTGKTHYFISVKKPLFDADRNIIGMFGVSTDITDIKHANIQQMTHGEVMTQIVNKAPLKSTLELLIKNIEGLSFSTEAKCSILLIDETGKHLLHGAAPSLPDFYNVAVDGIKIGDRIGSCGTAAYTKKRVIVEDIPTHPYWVDIAHHAEKAGLGSCWSEPILSTKGKLLGTLGIYHEESASPTEHDFNLIEFASQLATIAIEQSLAHKQQQLFQRVFDDSHEGIILMDSTGHLININSAFSSITGYKLSDVAGQKLEALDPNKKNADIYTKMWQKVAKHRHWQGELWNYKKNGETYVQLLTVSSIFDDYGELINYVGLFSDITQRKQQQKELERMAHYDVLTGLPNRSLFTDRFNRAIADSKRAEKQLAVCFIDLDNFKPVNDNFGHGVGDLLLIEVAKRISEVVREQDTVSRQGGDEFVVLLKDIAPSQQYKQVIERIHYSLAEPYIIDNIEHNIAASSGISIYPSDGDDIDTLLRHADQAMYQAKLSGKNRYEFFNLSQNQEWGTKRQQLDEIEQALMNDEFSLYYQPKIDMVSGKVFGVEALIRWLHPEKGTILPLDFLPLVTDTDLEITIGNWVIEQTLSQLHVWQQSGYDLQVSINVSSLHLQSNNFSKTIAEYLESHPSIKPQNIEFEVLENSTLNNLNTISKALTTCKEYLGVSFSLDDFGAGHSSLAHLRDLAVDSIKIDSDFINGILNDPSDYAIIDSVISLANAFNKNLIAEGVETTEQGLVLINMGCRQAQGNAIAPPMPAKDILSWLNNYSANEKWQHYGSTAFTTREKRVNLFILLGETWYNQFILDIQSPPKKIDPSSTLIREHCHCEYWLKRVKQEQVFEPEPLAKFETIHDELLAFSATISDRHLNNKINEARADLEQLTSLYNDMITAVKKCI